ncbi:hypothetical protein PCURB6_27010 [Paenibacillus curdlanolyticus]|nr:hypothetical protein PCURB6_27010 [Paenibacillus curdlanolyticus]
MKSEAEIREEIESTIQTLKNYHKSYSQMEIYFDEMCEKVQKCHTRIGVLKWVLGENDKYD